MRHLREKRTQIISDKNEDITRKLQVDAGEGRREEVISSLARR